MCQENGPKIGRFLTTTSGKFPATGRIFGGRVAWGVHPLAV